MTTTIGSILKETRLNQHLTQKAVAAGICSQAMLSSLEHDKYVPNAELIIALCQRLSLSLETLSLAQNYAISSTNSINQKLDYLCNHHLYSELLALLQKPSTIDQLESSIQTQSYYYYLAIAKYQTTSLTQIPIHHLNLALASFKSKSFASTLDRLCLSCLGLLKNIQSPTSGSLEITQSLNRLDETTYSSNLNILFYVAAFDAYHSKDYTACFKYIDQGIQFITKHNSHYMLANLYYLLARVAADTHTLNEKVEADQRSQIFSDLFDEKTYQDF